MIRLISLTLLSFVLMSEAPFAVADKALIEQTEPLRTIKYDSGDWGVYAVIEGNSLAKTQRVLLAEKNEKAKKTLIKSILKSVNKHTALKKTDIDLKIDSIINPHEGKSTVVFSQLYMEKPLRRSIIRIEGDNVVWARLVIVDVGQPNLNPDNWISIEDAREIAIEALRTELNYVAKVNDFVSHDMIFETTGPGYEMSPIFIFGGGGETVLVNGVTGEYSFTIPEHFQTDVCKNLAPNLSHEDNINC